MLQAYLEKENMDIQLVEPHKYRVNAAERAIQNFKSHLIAGLYTWDESFPSILWDKIIPQVQDSLNMLQTLRVQPNLST